MAGTSESYLAQFLNFIDLYGKQISITVDKSKSRISTKFGGAMTILFAIMSTSYMAYQIHMMRSL